MALQALGAGLPIVARAGNGAADLIQVEGVGGVYTDNSEESGLTAALDTVLRGGSELRMKARKLYERDFSKSTWTKNVDELYELAISRWASRK